MRSRPKEGSLAGKMLKLLEERGPDGVSCGELAALLYGENSPESRAKVRGLAKRLRRLGFPTFSLGGSYSLCGGDPERLALVLARGVRRARGFIRAALDAADGVEEAGCPARAEEMRRHLRESLLELAERL